MQSRHVITFIGDDRPGLVESVSSTVSSHGGNWLESRLSQLSSKFAGIVLISLPTDESKALETELKDLDREGLSVRLTPSIESTIVDSEPNFNLSIIGPDRPGIVREVSTALHAHGVNVIEMTTSVESAPMTGEMLFSASVTAALGCAAARDQLEDNLDSIANDMTLDIDIEHVTS